VKSSDSLATFVNESCRPVLWIGSTNSLQRSDSKTIHSQSMHRLAGTYII